MSLIDLQSALGTMVVAQASGHRCSIDSPGPFENLDLSTGERAWLAQLADSPGFKVTCKIQRWWRQTKLQIAVKLTMSALGAGAAELMNNYLEVTPCTSLFFIPEAIGFLEFVAAATEGQPHVAEVARFERAMLLARQAAVAESGSLRSDRECDSAEPISPHPAADIVQFSAPPELLLGSLLGGMPMPETGTHKSPVLIAPRLAGLWRPATADEYQVFEYSRNGATKEQLIGLLPGAGDALRELLAAGAFCEGPPQP